MENFSTFEGKTVVLTGGTSGIGLEMVRLLTPRCTLLVLSRPGPRLDALRERYPDVHTLPVDLSDPRQVETVADSILDRFPEVDALIHNAAVQRTPRFLDDDFAYEAMVPEIHLNLTAVCSLSYLLLPALIQDGRQTVIANINSGLALAPKTDSAVYCATKAAMDSFSRSLGYQLEATNVRVCQAFLPLVDTPMTAGRGSGKISAEQAARDILRGVESGRARIDIGKVKLLRFLLAVAPGLARSIMKGS